MSEIDPTVRPDVPLDDAPEEGLVAPQGVNESGERAAPDVRSGGDAAEAPPRDDDRFGAEDELVGAGPTSEDDVAHGDSGQDDGYID